ncbi:hypothetical protein PHYBOEH_004260 [Phytophthora boehmeriae]|uniref:FHA domain-containing protein n=1 Tax=Phytophthora boehmeriae TaxID=109152 RepID=A0A8T1WT59_9STRA|nr:hypothetical protein PHYBOEH_004260 [Phytophthora boehmeriae]
MARYEPPEWGVHGRNVFGIYLEVIKSGVVMEKLALPITSDSSCVVAGRMEPQCDLVLAHPSISRVHGALQFDEQGALFLCDLCSTHGCYVNKKRVKAEEFERLHIGDVLCFGESTRLYAVCGPAELLPAEYESLNLAKFREKLEKKKELREKKKQEEERGASWGFGEDAEEESDDDDDEEEQDQGKEQLPDYLRNLKEEDQPYKSSVSKTEVSEKDQRVYQQLQTRIRKMENLKLEKSRILAKQHQLDGLTEGQQRTLDRNEQRIDALMKEINDLEGRIHAKNDQRSKTSGTSGTLAKRRNVNEELYGYSSDEDDFYDRTKANQQKMTARKQRVTGMSSNPASTEPVKTSKAPKKTEVVTVDSIQAHIEKLEHQLVEIENELKMKELDRSGELLALCYRQQWEKAADLLQEDNVTATTVASAVHQAVVDLREETLLFLLEKSRPELLQINTSLQKDGRTLLHLALDGGNLRVIRALLAAGADVATPDKKSVKPMDLMTWTATTHPTIMVPLQDDLLHLQQRNASQLVRTQAVDEATTSVESNVQNLNAQAHAIEEDVIAARNFRKEVNAQITRAQDTDRDLCVQIQSEEQKLEWIRGEIDRLHTQNASADQEMARITGETQKLVAASAVLRGMHERQQQARADIAAKSSIKLEVVGLIRQFPENEALQTRSLRAMLVLWKKPKLRHQLLVNGLQNVVIEALERFPGRSAIHLPACQLIDLVSATTYDPETVGPWSTKTLVKDLLASCESMKKEVPTGTIDEVCYATSAAFKCLEAAQHLNDISGSELRECLSAAAQELLKIQSTIES